jgi:hypothetical protein
MTRKRKKMRKIEKWKNDKEIKTCEISTFESRYFKKI